MEARLNMLALAVALDESLERGPELWWWGHHRAYADAHAYANADAHAYAHADAYAYAYANADANAYANAYADAYVDVDADADADAKSPKLSTRGLTVRPGLYLYTAPSSDSVAVLRVAWLRHAIGDPDPLEYEAVHSVTPLRSEYSTMFSDAQDRPPVNWRFTEPLKRPSPLHRAQIRNPVALDPVGWAKVCPRPPDWEEA